MANEPKRHHLRKGDQRMSCAPNLVAFWTTQGWEVVEPEGHDPRTDPPKDSGPRDEPAAPGGKLDAPGFSIRGEGTVTNPTDRD